MYRYIDIYTTEGGSKRKTRKEIRMEEMNKKVSKAAGSDFSTLSEDCIVYILAMTSPLDVCRIRAVARWLLPAVDSDALWRTFLPDDYEQIVAGAVESSALAHSSKKELFFRLCNSDYPLLIDQAKKVNFTPNSVIFPL